MTRLIITVVVILVVVGVVLATTGVLRFRNTKDESTITIDKKELKEEAQKAVEKTGEAGGKILDKTGETLHKAAEGLRGSPDDKHEPTKTPAAGENESTRQPGSSKTPPEDKESKSDR